MLTAVKYNVSRRGEKSVYSFAGDLLNDNDRLDLREILSVFYESEPVTLDDIDEAAGAKEELTASGEWEDHPSREAYEALLAQGEGYVLVNGYNPNDYELYTEEGINNIERVCILDDDFFEVIELDPDNTDEVVEFLNSVNVETAEELVHELDFRGEFSDYDTTTKVDGNYRWTEWSVAKEEENE